MQQISPLGLKQWLDEAAAGQRPLPVMIDVREPDEHAICKIDGALLMPMRTIPARCSELDRDAPTVVICHHGGRSAQVGMFLEQQGFSQIINLSSGVHGWAAQVDPAMPQY